MRARTVLAAAGLLLLGAGVPAHASRAARDGLIAYDVGSPGGGYALVVSAPGGLPRLLPRLPAYALTPRWSPDGRWIAFSGCAGASSPCQLYVVRADGSGLRQVTHDPAGLTTPSWLPGSRQLLAARGDVSLPRSGFLDGDLDGLPLRSSVVTVDLRTGAVRTVTASDQEVAYPSYSSVARAVVFSAGTYDLTSLTDWTKDVGAQVPGDANASRIEAVHLDGTGLTVLGVGITPDVSPDGARIAYTGLTEDEGNEQVHVMGVDGRGDRTVTQLRWADNPTWAPDGHSVLVTAARTTSDVAHVMLVDLRTGALHDLVTSYSAFADEQPR